ncbi:MAG TPA: ABC transporter permease, partial [Longimicrobiaceae bacterium]
LASTLRLQLRNRMGMIYGYIFPTIFLVSFWVLYRYEPVPLIRHLGELLTVTALGGACFGLPTSLVSERERGVWRRYRLAPVSTGSLVGSTVVARYLLLLSAALLQLVLAMAIGMPLPAHPLGLWVAFTFVAFAFLGLGLVIAMLADNVPAVQALGQSIFLPMLIIGGVAVRLDSLPAWAQHLSAFFPGRYAVQALQASATGGGLGEAGFSLLALTLIGAAGCVAAAKMFRWDARERFVTRGGKGWIGVALGTWVVVGLLGESLGTVEVARGGDGVRPPGVLGGAVGGGADSAGGRGWRWGRGTRCGQTPRRPPATAPRAATPCGPRRRRWPRPTPRRRTPPRRRRRHRGAGPPQRSPRRRARRRPGPRSPWKTSAATSASTSSRRTAAW